MTARCFLSPPRLLAAHIPQLVKVRRNWNGFTSSLNRAMLIEESLCSLPSQTCLASHQLMIMSTINACPRASHFRFFSHNKSKENNNSTHQTGKNPYCPLSPAEELDILGERAAFVLGQISVHPWWKLHPLLLICISHVGPVPSGKFPAPVHVSLQSQTSCSTSFSKGQHALLQAAPWGRVVVWPLDRPPQKKGDAFLPSACPKAEMKGTSGTLPAALGAWWCRHLTMCYITYGAGCDTN